MKIVMLGPPASGKGTQAELLSRKLNLPQISVGELLREEYAKRTKEGKQAEKYFDKGKLAPHTVIMKIVKKRLAKKDCKNGYIFDGFPRALAQARALLRIDKPDKVIYLKLPDSLLMKRMMSRTQCSKGHTYGLGNTPKKKGVCNIDKLPLHPRSDDTPDIMRQRIKIFHTTTEPVLRLFDKYKIMRVVRGSGSIQSIHQRVLSELKK